MKILYTLAAFLGATHAQNTISGGLITQEFKQCGINRGCQDAGASCCSFYLEEYDYQQDFCVPASLRSADGSGIYQDTENYPFPKYSWQCRGPVNPTDIDGDGRIDYDPYYDPYYGQLDVYPYGRFFHYGDGQYGYGTYPIELRNDDNWGFAWYHMIVYTLCGAFGVLGWPIFAANMVLYTLMMTPADLKAFYLLLFGDYYGRYLAFNDWIVFSIRRHMVERAIEFVSFFVMLIPGGSLVLMPMLGLLQVWNLVDF